jgi:hypothetical protein
MVSRERYRGFYGGPSGAFTLMARQLSDVPSRDFLQTQSGLFAGMDAEKVLRSLPGFSKNTTTNPYAVQNANAYLNLRRSLAKDRKEAAARKGAKLDAALTDQAELRRLQAFKNAKQSALKGVPKGIALKRSGDQLLVRNNPLSLLRQSLLASEKARDKAMAELKRITPDDAANQPPIAPEQRRAIADQQAILQKTINDLNQTVVMNQRRLQEKQNEQRDLGPATEQEAIAERQSSVLRKLLSARR